MNTDVKTTNSELSRTGALRRRMNIVLVRVADLRLEGKRAEEISFADIVGNLDALGYLIIFISLVGTLLVALISGMLLVRIWPNFSAFVSVASLPGVIAGFCICYVLFRFRRWLKS